MECQLAEKPSVGGQFLSWASVPASVIPLSLQTPKPPRLASAAPHSQSMHSLHHSFALLRMSATLASLVRTTSRALGPRLSTLTVLARSSATLVQKGDEMATPQELSSNKMFGGFNRRFKHDSTSAGCPMTFTVYFPPAAHTEKVPVLYWLSGLSCNDENFIQKSGAQRKAAACGIALVSMDTSPRGLNVEGESENWDFGTGAGFYLNATQEKWKNWRMYDYLTKELPSLLSSHFPQLDTANASLFGHSMGGHGAITLFLKNSSKYKSVSAFAPICNPTQCPWGDKAFKGYLGEDKSTWEEYDATLLVKKYNGPKTTILIDQGDGDKFYKEKQLLPENFEAACKSAGMPVELRMQPGYDHSYFFIASFVEDHIQHHAKALGL